MKTNTKTQHEESTYALLVRSQEEDRSVPETAIYLLLMLTMAFAGWQTVQQRFELPRIGLLGSVPIAQVEQAVRPSA